MPFSIVGAPYQQDLTSLLGQGYLGNLSAPATGAPPANLLPYYLQGGYNGNNGNSLAQLLGSLGVAAPYQGQPIPAGLANPNATPPTPQPNPLPSPPPPPAPGAPPVASAPQPSAYTGLPQQLVAGGWQQAVSADGTPYVTAPDGSVTYLNGIPYGAPTVLTGSGSWGGYQYSPPTQTIQGGQVPAQNLQAGNTSPYQAYFPTGFV